METSVNKKQMLLYYIHEKDILEATTILQTFIISFFYLFSIFLQIMNLLHLRAFKSGGICIKAVKS